MYRSLCVLIALSLGLPSAPARGEDDVGADPLPEHHVAEPAAAAVTEENLLASERFWPYQVALAKPWQPPGRSEPLPPGIDGVLIRVEESGVARIDFGRDGLYEVPVSATDLVARANRVRAGELEKMAPNFVLDVGPRLMDAAADSLRPFGLRTTAVHDRFLCVFADPGAEGFAELAQALAPLRNRSGLLTVLFAQGKHPDARLRDQLRSLEWPTPFVLDHLAEPYTPSLLGEGVQRPALLLVTREGRVLFRGPWRPGAMTELGEALDRAPAGSAATQTEAR